jgi:hypothetical protein
VVCRVPINTNRLRGDEIDHDLASWPRIAVVVATLNEAVLIPGKIRNLGAAADPRVTLIHAGVAGKTAQPNLALEHVDTPWVLVTDADTRLHPDTIRRMVDATPTGAPYGQRTV